MSILLRKRDGSFRWWIDLRKLNDVIVKDYYPLPLLHDYIDACQYFTTVDMASGYYELEVALDVRHMSHDQSDIEALEHMLHGVKSIRRMI